MCACIVSTTCQTTWFNSIVSRSKHRIIREATVSDLSCYSLFNVALTFVEFRMLQTAWFYACWLLSMLLTVFVCYIEFYINRNCLYSKMDMSVGQTCSPHMRRYAHLHIHAFQLAGCHSGSWAVSKGREPIPECLGLGWSKSDSMAPSYESL